MYYTLGQRQGLHIGGRKGSEGKPWYVMGKDLAQNILYVVEGSEHTLLYSRWLDAFHLHWVSRHAVHTPLRCTAKTRYRQQDVACVIQWIEGDRCHVTFEDAQWAVTPGQSIVFYQDEYCLGGGVITQTERTAEGW